ncbi:hypothetical protein, partial [uncultured Phascolarctobacterium sp.]|uniref:hypothetical protein n=1 Tax=uncultured Phascolarctobacterium sp. TaxID=512296 RepID=UPI0026387C06
NTDPQMLDFWSNIRGSVHGRLFFDLYYLFAFHRKNYRVHFKNTIGKKIYGSQNALGTNVYNKCWRCFLIVVQAAG